MGILPIEAVGLLAARFRIENVFGVGIKRGKSGDGGNQHAHGMGVVVKSVEKFFDAFVNEGVMRDVVGPVFQLRFRRQFAAQKQIGGFEIRALLGEFFDRISAVAKDAFVAIDERDLAGTRRRVAKRRVVAHHSEIDWYRF